jgi:exonuclease 1
VVEVGGRREAAACSTTVQSVIFFLRCPSHRREAKYEKKYCDTELNLIESSLPCCRMGIKGLWQALRAYVDDGHLSQFRGQRVAVDMYVWLHRCIHRSVRVDDEAVLVYLEAKYSSGSSTDGSDGPPLPSVEAVLVLDDQFITQVLDKVSALQRFGVTPICVFDGDEMPMKGNTDEERQKRRQGAFLEAMLRLEQLYCEERRRRGVVRASGHSMTLGGEDDTVGHALQQRSRTTLPHTSRLYEEALQLLEKAVDISTELAHAVIQVLKEERNVECIVAPYEADAQLAYLCREGYVAAAVSEDSDLIAYYCPCVISKLDTMSGKCEVLQPAVCAPQFFCAMAATAATTTSGASHSSSALKVLASGGGLNHLSTHTLMRAAAAQPLHHSPLSPVGSVHGEGAQDAVRGAATTSFTYESFLLGCIMAGCDYVANLRNIGVKKAFKLVTHATSLRQVFALLETEYGFSAAELVPYRRRVLEAFYCFVHHLVYCPLRQEIVTFHPLPTVANSAVDGGAATTTTTAAAVVLKTHLVGSRWEREVAQDVCARCLCDPCTLRLYRGTYQSCVTRYLQRTRRGQTSLKAYAGFEDLTSNKVVVHLGSKPHCVSGPTTTAGMKRERPDGSPIAVKEEESGFGAPLRKKQEACGFLGSTSAAAEGHTGSGEVVVVRSRYFLHRGRTAVCEQWSASEEEEGSDGGEGGDSHCEVRNTAVKQRSATNVSRAPEVPLLHTARLPGAPSHRLLGLSRPPRHSPSPPSASTVVKTEGGRMVVNSTSGAVVGTTAANEAVQSEVKLADEKSGDRGCGCMAREQGSGVDAARLKGGNGSPGSAASLTTMDSAANVGRSATETGYGSVDGSNTQDTLQGDGPHGVSCTASRQHSPCLAETVDVEPYTYPMSSSACVGGCALTTPQTELHTLAPLQPCACPFGYHQCNRAHSVFESCFLGKQWSRDEKSLPPPPATAPTSVLLSSSTPVSPTKTAPSPPPLPSSHVTTCQPHGSAAPFPDSGNTTTTTTAAALQRCSPRGFRPPRSTAFPAAPAGASLAVTVSGATATATKAAPSASCESSADDEVASSSSTTTTTVSTTEPRAVLQGQSAKPYTRGKEVGRVLTQDGVPSTASAAAVTPSLLLPPSMPSHRAAVRMAIFDQMAFKKAA